MNNFKNVGDLRGDRDPTADSALKALLADPAAASVKDAADHARNAGLLAQQDDAISGATERRIDALTAQFGDWAVVADVLASDGMAGDALAAELAKCQTEAPTATAWMRQNF